MATTILSSRFNNLRNRIAAIMGNSTASAPTTGYGQTFDSQTVVGSRDVNDLSTANTIDAQQYVDLYTDMVRARVHQVGSSFTIDPFVVGDYLTNTTSTDKIEDLYITNLENLMTSIEQDKFEIDLSTQASVETLRNASNTTIASFRPQNRTGPWNGTLSHIFTVDFPSLEVRRHFFNAGGQIRFSANLVYNFSQTKTTQWKNSLASMGNVAFKANETTSLSTGGTRQIGNYDLTSTYQLAFRFSIGGLYTGSYYEIYALENSDTQIQFRVYFRDSDPEATDEDVFGDLTSTIQFARPDGQVDIGGTTIDTVVVNVTPVGTNISEL